MNFKEITKKKTNRLTSNEARSILSSLDERKLKGKYYEDIQARLNELIKLGK